MSNNNEKPKIFSIGEILKQDNYIIPIYQRNYAWGHEEITQLIQDIWDYCQADKDKNYYIGTLVTHEILGEEHKDKYEVLDGQQRLTTLYILVAALKSLGQEQGIKDITETLNLHFEARKESTQTLRNILENKIEGEQQQSIIDGFGFAKDYLEEQIKKENLQAFVEYLLNKVILVRTKVPEDTDLNHYFEIMNNRGEQLEKHEILKARLLDAISKENQEGDKKLVSQYAKVWEACSQMKSYVQMNFDKSDRDKFFGYNWNTLKIEKIADTQGDVEKAVDSQNQDSDENNSEECEKEENKNTIDCILKKGISGNDGSETGGGQSEKFESIIDFPNFLLQVLTATFDEKGSLDDKRLLEEFKKYLPDGKGSDEQAKKERSKKAMTFIDNLLKHRFWFDKYIIKREATGDKNWSLRSWVKKNEDNYYPENTFSKKGEEDNEESTGMNNDIIMIQSMFHVSNPIKSNKRWLQEIFKRNDIVNNGEIDAGNFLSCLERISRDLLDDEHLKPRRYHFNLLDYVIWKKSDKIDDDTKKDFSFKFRNSKEHFYPQNPTDEEKLNDDSLHSFGNLAWTTKSKNSSLSNSMPHKKAEKIDKQHSLKLQLMAIEAKKGENNWNAKTINEHQEAMQKLLDGYLQKT